MNEGEKDSGAKAMRGVLWDQILLIQVIRQ